jgi:glycosyltransferase involved in cell wall biosynthesis
LRIAILAGGLWHETEVEISLRNLGHETLLLNATTLIQKNPILGKVSDLLVRVSNKVPALLPASRYFFFAVTRPLVKRFNPSVLIVWSSYALEFQKRESWPVVLVRGSSHIQQQFEIFKSFPRGNLFKLEKGPSRWSVAREREEYAAAVMVTVPTREISETTLWGSSNVTINPYGFNSHDNIAHREIHPSNHPVKLLCAGQTSLRKGIDRLAELASKAKNVTVNVYGPLVQPKAAFESDNVVYGGNLSRADLQVEYKRHDVFVLLSREEGMARAGMEAISAGLPIVVTRATGLSIWCELGAGICLEDGYTESQFWQAINAVTANRNGFEKNCLEVSQGWSWANHAELLISQITDALESQ